MLHRIASLCISLHRTASHRISLHRIASHRIASHCIALHRIASHCIALHRTASHCIAWHRIASHCIALHRIASHYTVHGIIITNLIKLNFVLFCAQRDILDLLFPSRRSLEKNLICPFVIKLSIDNVCISIAADSY